MKKVLIIADLKRQACENYVKACVAAGLSPTVSDTVVDPRYYDGLILPGGIDISPRFYGESNQKCETVDLAYDQLEYSVLDAFVQAGKPVLGICRGLQFLNVYFGGSLIQDVPGHKLEGKLHLVKCTPHAAFARLFNDELMVNSYHHQSIKRLGDGLEVFAYSDDGMVEGISHISNKIFGVQWHPELSMDDTMDKSGGIYVYKVFAAVLAQND